MLLHHTYTTLLLVAKMAEVDDSLFNRAETAAQRDKDSVLDRLDVLLERYLNTLHEYQKVMQELSKQLSSVCCYSV